MNTMRALVGLCLAAALILGGCASIPLSTALSLSTMSARSLAQLDPGQVQVRVSVLAGFTLNVPSTRLNLELKGAAGSRAAAMGLTTALVSRSVRSGGLFSPDVPVTTYTLRLTPEAVGQLRDIQQFILATNPNHFEFGLQAPFATVPKNAQEVVFWADLKLSNQDGFKPLIDGAKVRFRADKAGS